MMKTFNIAIAGFGNVGRATATLLLSRRMRYRKVYDADVRLVAVCGSQAGLFKTGGLEEEDLGTLEEGFTGPEFIEKSGADIVIESGPSDFRTGGPGLAYLRSALAVGRDAIVVSKGALVHSGTELRNLATNSGAMLKLSGAAAAALPTIDMLNHSLRGCQFVEIEGILNATTNYLLDAMVLRGVGFDIALREAQEGGFAEADPRNDTEGWDTACKLLLIANFGLGANLKMDDIKVAGLQSVTAEQIDEWRHRQLVPKLLGRLNFVNNTLAAQVGILPVPLSDTFANVRGKDKAIRITTDVMGTTIAISSGKEPVATAAAALKDLEHILEARHAESRSVVQL